MQNSKQITLILIIAIMFMLDGCASITGVITTNNTNLQIREFEPLAIKTLYTDTLKTLVTSKTITQAQSDKIVVTLTTNMPKRKPNKNLINKKGAKIPNNNKIMSLVTSGIITQANADKIIEKISQAITINRSREIS